MSDNHDPIPVRVVGPPLTGAQKRKRAGLTVAGAGFLAADRAKSIAPGAADWMTRSAKKIGEAEHAKRTAHKTALIARHGGRGGAALAAGGLVLAAEGAISDAKDKAKIKVKEHKAKQKAEMVDVPVSGGPTLTRPFGKREAVMDELAKSAFFAKADDDEGPHVLRVKAKDKATGAKRNAQKAEGYASLGAIGGITGATIAATGHEHQARAKSEAQGLANHVRARQRAFNVPNAGASRTELSEAKELGRIYRTAGRVKVGGLIGGGAAVAGGTAAAVHNARKSNKQWKEAKDLQLAAARAGDRVAKSAFFSKADDDGPRALQVRAANKKDEQKRSGEKAAGYAAGGTLGAGVGVTASAVGHEVRQDAVRDASHVVGRAVGRGHMTPEEMSHLGNINSRFRLGGKVKVGGLIGGGAALAAGTAGAVHHGRKANKQGREARDLQLAAAAARDRVSKADDDDGPNVLRVKAKDKRDAAKQSAEKAGGYASLGAIGGITGASVAGVAHEARRQVKREVNNLGMHTTLRNLRGHGGATPAEMRIAGQLGRDYRIAGKIRTGGIIGGGAAAAAGGAAAVHHARKSNKQVREAKDLQMAAARAGDRVSKSAFFSKDYDPEAQRHKRAAIYEGAAAGGSAVAAGTAVDLARRTKAQAAKAKQGFARAQTGRAEAHGLAGQMAQVGGPARIPAATKVAAKLKAAEGAEQAAKGRLKIARKLSHGAKGAAAGAAALGLTAAAIHRNDGYGSGRSYY